ncbi:MAG: TolC family protein [Acidobacteriia bacterium]|nr:TolC family protein [Terriglobia bacterium]
MTRTGTIWTLTAALVCASLATTARAQQLSEARIRELIKQAAERTAIGVAVDPQQPAAATPGANRPVVRMTLDDAVKLTLDRNLDIAVQRLSPEINDISVAKIRSVYHPSLTSTLATQSTTTPANSTLAGSNTAGAAVVAGLSTYNGGLTQAVPWGGGNFNVLLNNNRTTTTSLNTLYDPTYNTNWSGQYTQPLLRNRQVDSTRQQIAVTRISRDISDVQLRATITNTVSNVRNAYWDYVFAVQSVDVAQRSLDLAEQLVKDNQTRVEVGTMAPIDVVQAQSQSAAQRQNLVVAQGAMRTAELALKRLIVSGTADPNWNVQIDPVDRPDFRPEPIDVEAAVRRALSERTDLEIAKKNVSSNDATLSYLRDQLKPQADFVATYGLVGLGGTQLIKSGTSVNSTVSGTVPGGYGDALSTLVHNNFPRWTAQVNFSYPLGLSSQEASVARARVQLNQVQAQMKQIELQVATDVTNAAITVQSGAERVQAAQAARELAQKQLEAETSKFEVGMSTNYNVIQSQRDLATAQNNELQSILNYRKALVELERLQQTTLQNLNISILSPQ